MCVGSHLAIYRKCLTLLTLQYRFACFGRLCLYERQLRDCVPRCTCIAANMLAEMKYIVAALYSNYSTSIVDDTGIEQSDSYTAPPKSDKLMIRLEQIAAQS
jgi:hypothetical protein